jgi:hypothetical protein
MFSPYRLIRDNVFYFVFFFSFYQIRGRLRKCFSVDFCLMEWYQKVYMKHIVYLYVTREIDAIGNW